MCRIVLDHRSYRRTVAMELFMSRTFGARVKPSNQRHKNFTRPSPYHATISQVLGGGSSEPGSPPISMCSHHSANLNRYSVLALGVPWDIFELEWSILDIRIGIVTEARSRIQKLLRILSSWSGRKMSVHEGYRHMTTILEGKVNQCPRTCYGLDRISE